MSEQEPQPEQNPFKALADTLDDLQRTKNDGRGVSCIETLVMFLRRGDLDAARAVGWNEADKIVSYPDIRKLLQQELYAGVDERDTPPHFRTSSDKLYDR